MLKSKIWPLEIYNDNYAKQSACRKFVLCDACGISGRTQGLINMRHPYSSGNWNSHITSQMHVNSVANKEAKKEVNILKGKKRRPMTTFFTAQKKKVGEITVVEVATASNTVDLTRVK